MAISISSGQEMKMTIKSSGDSGTSRTIRYLNPLATNATEQNITGLAKKFLASSKNSYVSTSGSIELGILEEED